MALFFQFFFTNLTATVDGVVEVHIFFYQLGQGFRFIIYEMVGQLNRGTDH
jgi:surface polysaccharide O-acyltransferase-like enzyme